MTGIVEGKQRNKILKSNISFGALFKVLGMGLSYISLPIVLNYLGEKNYGVWITIFSILSWIYTFDVGVGNGLKIRLTEALSKKNISLAREYISTAYILIFLISLVLLCLGGIGIFSTDLKSVLGVDHLAKGYLQQVIFITFIFTMTNFVVGLYKQLLFAIHLSAYIALTNILLQLIVITSLLLLDYFFKASLFLVALVYGFANLVTGIIFSFVFFRKRMYLFPKFSFVKRNRVRDIAGIGINFFIIQLTTIVIFTSDNLIITKLLGPEAVTPYSVVYQFFQIFIVFWYIISAPLTPLYTDAYINNDTNWIKNTLKNLNKLFIVVVCLVFFAVLIAKYLIGLWVGMQLQYPRYIFLFFGFFVLIRIYGDLYMSFLNSIGKLKWQLYLSIFGAVINIPLSLLFVETFEFGSSGVILATCISLLLLAIVMPIQAYLELKR